MNRFARLSFLVATALLSVGCTKCYWPEDTVRDITYTIAPATSAIDNATTTTIHLETEAEWQALLDRFCGYAEDGSEVTFYNASRVQNSQFKIHNSAKDATTFSTTDREEMKRWMAQMEDEGMTVTVSYDPNTGTWNGTAYATAPSPTPDPLPTLGCDVLTYVCDASPMWRIILSVDTANQLMFFTGMMYDSINTFVGYNLMVPDGFCRYNYFDPQDSGYYNYYNDRVFIFIQNLDQPSQANHYCLIGNFDFSSNSFTLEFEDYAPQDLNTVISFPFVRTDEFGLMMHRCERCDVLIHMGYGEGQSYIFPRFDGDFPFEHGKFTITAVDATASDGYGYFHEVFRLRYSITGSEPIFGTYYTDGISEDWYPLNYTTSAMWPAYFHFKKY
jgi:hypothetical protein